MSATEKAYLKKYALKQQQKQSSYLTVFTKLDRWLNSKKNDEDLVNKLFEKEVETLFNNRKPANVKSYLYEMILKALRLFYAKDEPIVIITELLSNCTVLIRKEMFNEAAHFAQRAYEKANYFHFDTLKITALAYLELLENRKGNFGDKFKLKEYGEQTAMLINELSENSKLKVAYGELLNEIITKGNSAQSITEQSEALQSNLLLNADYHSLTSKQKSIYLNGQEMLAYYLGDSEAALAAMEQKFELYEQHEGLWITNPTNLEILYFNYLIRNLELRNFDAYNTALPKALTFIKKLKYNATTFGHLTALEIYYNYYTNNFEGTVAKSAEYKEDIKRFRTTLQPAFKLDIIKNILYAQFIVGNYKACSVWVDFLLEEGQKDIQLNINSAIRLVNIICYYELNNHELLEYYVRNTTRYLLQLKQLSQLEKLLLKMFKKLSGIANDKQLTAILKSNYTNIKSLLENPAEAQILSSFNVLCWIDSKINGTTFRKELVAQEKLRLPS